MSGTTSRAKKSSPQSTKKEIEKDEIEQTPTIEETPKDDKPLAVVEGSVQEDSETAQESIIESLVERIDILEQALSKFATLSGHGNYLREFGIERWNPSQKDMRKYG